MENTIKKVVLVIVEGESEEILMNECLKELFNNHQIHFEVQRVEYPF
ncbi:hypothetical protein [Paraliobacillus sp. X-1268]|nr:hypothetical protein [Paraliobacillus sp. X-1268]